MDRALRTEAFIAAARGFVGVRWRHRGRSKFGVDCIGLVVLALRAADCVLQDRQDYGRYPWNDGLDAELRDQIGNPVEGMQPGDILTMRGLGQPAAGHVGIVAEAQGYLTVIHSYNADSNCVVTEHRIDEAWQRRICNVYRPFP